MNNEQPTKQIFKDRNHFYIRIGEGYVVPLLLILHDHNRFTDIQFHELITVLQSIIKSNFKSSGLSSTFLTSEQSATSKPLYLSDLGFTFRFAPTYPKYSIFIKNPTPQHNNDNIKIKRKETIYIDSDEENKDDPDNTQEEDEEEKEYYDEQINKKGTSRKKKRSTTTTTTTTLKPSYNCEVIETRYDREEREKKEKEKEQKEEEENMDILNDRAIAKALQDDHDDVIEIKDEEGEDVSQPSSQQEVYQGGIYKGLMVTGKTIIIETLTKVADANTLPLNSFLNQPSTSGDDSDEDDDFNLPDRQSQSTASSKYKSSKSTSSTTNVKKKSTTTTTTNTRKSKSTISTNNNTNISTYFK